MIPAVRSPSPPAAAPAALPAPLPPPSAVPRGRPSWSGLLRISLVAVPVKAFPAVSSASASHFHLLHAECGQRIQYHKSCPQHGPLTADAIAKGYERGPRQYVIVEPEELDQLRPARDKALVLDQFVPLAAIDPTFFAGRSLYLFPDGAAAQHPYAVLAEALQETRKGALGRVVLSSQRQLVLARAAGRLLIVHVLHYPAEVRNRAAWETDLPPSAASEAERELARQLIALASTPLDWTRYRDTSAEELAALIEAKVAKQPPPSPADEPVVVLHLMDALKQSIEQARHGSAASAAKGRKPRGRKAAG
jgi:DNA end-binding protein Ku